jgi:hypothetical protein
MFCKEGLAANAQLRSVLEHGIQTLAPHHMLWDAASIIYTDYGSCIEKENGTHNALGAGVCRPNCAADTAHVLPCGLGPTNTINRAELCAIYHVVNQTCRFNRNETIATDSSVLAAYDQPRTAPTTYTTSCKAPRPDNRYNWMCQTTG